MIFSCARRPVSATESSQSKRSCTQTGTSTTEKRPALESLGAASNSSGPGQAERRLAGKWSLLGCRLKQSSMWIVYALQIPTLLKLCVPAGGRRVQQRARQRQLRCWQQWPWSKQRQFTTWHQWRCAERCQLAASRQQHRAPQQLEHPAAKTQESPHACREGQRLGRTHQPGQRGDSEVRFLEVRPTTCNPMPGPDLGPALQKLRVTKSPTGFRNWPCHSNQNFRKWRKYLSARSHM